MKVVLGVDVAEPKRDLKPLPAQEDDRQQERGDIDCRSTVRPAPSIAARKVESA